MKIIPISKNILANYKIHNAILFIATNNDLTHTFKFHFYKLNKIHHNKYPATVEKRRFCAPRKAYCLHGKHISFSQHFTKKMFKQLKRHNKLKVFL